MVGTGPWVCRALCSCALCHSRPRIPAASAPALPLCSRLSTVSGHEFYVLLLSQACTVPTSACSRGMVWLTVGPAALSCHFTCTEVAQVTETIVGPSQGHAASRPSRLCIRAGGLHCSGSRSLSPIARVVNHVCSCRNCRQRGPVLTGRARQRTVLPFAMGRNKVRALGSGALPFPPLPTSGSWAPLDNPALDSATVP